jgi:hypothetical protein
MLSQAVKDSIALGGTGETDLSFAGATSPVTLRSSTGDSVAFVAGDYITLAATDSTMTINSVTNLSVTQGASGETSVVVDNLTDVRLPWDGSAVVGVVESGSQTTIFLTVNGQQVQFDPIPNGDKGDIIVSDAGAVMVIDTAVVDWDNLTQALKDSILAAGEFNPVDSIQFVTTYEGTATTGKMIWNAQSGTVHLGMSGDIEMPLGQAEAHLVRNVTGSQIAKGKVVYISGATGQRPQISLADADAEMSSSVTFGITAEAINNNDSGFVFVSGYIKGINTSALTEGEALWLDTVPGGFTHDKPTAPVHSVLVGYVITKKNNGEIFVKVQNGYELGELHNVNTQGAVARDILRYNGTIWQPGKDTSLYNMDATLKGNRLISMGNADLQFRQAAGGADYVQIKKDFVLVGNTTTGNNAVVNQYGIKQDETGGNNTEIYMTGGQITMRGNTSADNIGLDPDFTIASSGVVKIRRSASGAVDSLYGKNSSGELLAVKGVGTANIADGAVTNAKIENDAVTSAKIANYSIGPSEYGINYYLLNDSASVAVDDYIDGTVAAYRKMTVYTYIDSLTTANKNITLPTPSFTYQGFEINFITENYNDSYAGTITLKTATGTYFRYYDTAVSKWVVKNGIDIQDVPSFRIICINLPRSGNDYYWVGTASGN